MKNLVGNGRSAAVGIAAADPVKVIFRIWDKEFGGEVVALFPGLAGDMSPSTCQSYQHTGQHGAASVALSSLLRLATPEEYADLADELRRIGYNLKVASRFTPSDLQARKEQLKR